MFICVVSLECVHVRRLSAGVCVFSICVRESVCVGTRQELKRPWDEYVEQM